MICSRCGRNNNNNEPICRFCGERLNDIQANNNLNNRNYNYQFFQQPDKSKVIIKYNYKSETFGFTFFQIILGIVLIVVFVILLLTCDNWDIFKEKEGNEYISSYKPDKSAKDILVYMKVFFVIGIVFNIILLSIKIIKLISISNTYLCLTESGVFGKGGTNSYLGNTYINVRYIEIISARKQAGCVMIDSIEGNCKFLLDNGDEAVNEINRRVFYLKTRESFRYY